MTNPIDDAHCDLIYGLVVSAKPATILELGYGQGRSMGTIWQAIGFNQMKASYTLLDNWADHGGKVPEYLKRRFELANFKTEILSMEEADFWANCPIPPGSLDLLVSDADHGNADQTFAHALGLMRTGGILIYHDVSNLNHPNLKKIPSRCAIMHINYMIFDKSSRHDEECERGLLVVKT